MIEKKQEIVVDAILGVLAEHELTINECYQVLEKAESTIEIDVGKGILRLKD